ncbi:hypothetical protein [Streptosporangium roseum]|uniref:hypothetical protein n=1 Tax=Streptosporangium roseum TaxID=2001 RepID=UPI00331CD191
MKIRDVREGTHTPASGGGSYLYFRADIIAPDGAIVGLTDRKWIRELDGTVWAEHERQRIDKPHRGKGAGSAWGRHLNALYYESEFDRIELFASDDDGGYMWASVGFDFKEAWGAQAVIDQLTVELRRLTRERSNWSGDSDDPRLAGIIEDIRLAERILHDAHVGFGNAGFPSAERISQAGRKPGMKYRVDDWLGARVMADSEWDGVKYL